MEGEQFKQFAEEFTTGDQKKSEGDNFITPEEVKRYVAQGWITPNTLAKEVGIDDRTVRSKVNGYRSDHPEWFTGYRDKGGQVREYYAPELGALIKQEAAQYEFALEGWMTTHALAKKIGIVSSTLKSKVDLYRSDYPEWFKEYRDTGGRVTKHYAPELVRLIEQQVTMSAPEGWINARTLAEKVGIVSSTLKSKVNLYRSDHPEWFKEYRDTGGHVREHYAPELVALIKQEVAQNESAPEGWMTVTALANEVGIDRDTVRSKVNVYRSDHPEWFKEYRGKGGHVSERYAPELVVLVKQGVVQYEFAPEGWITPNTLAKEVGIDDNTVRSKVNVYRSDHPEWFKEYRDKGGHVGEYYASELVDLVKQEVAQNESAPEGWITTNALAKKIGIAHRTLKSKVDLYRRDHPEWFKEYKDKRGKLAEHYAPELIQEITNIVQSQREGRQLQADLQKTLEQLQDPTSAVYQQLRELIDFFGAAQLAHLLVLYDKRFRAIPGERRRKILGEYLGGTSEERGPITKLPPLEDIENVLEKPELRAAMIERLKDHFFYQFKTLGKEEGRQWVHEHEMEIKDKPRLQSVFTEVKQYYEDLYALSLPSSMVAELKPAAGKERQREFPDLNQRLNIKEIELQKRLLIADEMGLGKSASVIIALERLKEQHARVQTALIVCPANVVDTWKGYLEGYFKEGHKPRVLEINSEVVNTTPPQDASSRYDYIIITQEKLGRESYEEWLNGLQYQFTIVDEIHKLKNIEKGKRAQHFRTVASKSEYCALLSGTPVPNSVKDIAIILQIVHPEEYGNRDIKELIQDIVYGDPAILHEQLNAKMQRKTTSEVLNLPPKTEAVRTVPLGDEEQKIYDFIQDQDEIPGLEKLMYLRQVVLNPELFGESVEQPTKMYDAILRLAEVFSAKNKAVVFVNDYVEGIIRDTVHEKSMYILEQVQKQFEEINTYIETIRANGLYQLDPSALLDHLKTEFPAIEEYVENTFAGLTQVQEGPFIKAAQASLPHVRVMRMDGSTPRAKRAEIQQEFQTSEQKTLLVVSGQTADVGIDLSSAEYVMLYNVPWNRARVDQEVGRVYREGLAHPLEVDIMVVNNTIEAGMRRYIEVKQEALDKLIKGVPLSELEKQIVITDTQDVDELVEVDAGLAEFYLGINRRLMRLISQTREIGEESFLKSLPAIAEEYASLYTRVGLRGYTSNNVRVAGNIINRLIRADGVEGRIPVVLDVGSGPEMLKKITEDTQSAAYIKKKIISIDAIKEHFSKESVAVAGQFGALPIKSGEEEAGEAKGVDYINMSLAFQTTNLVPSREIFDRAETLVEINRVLKTGGKAVITIPPTIRFKNGQGGLERMAQAFGFTVVKPYTGMAHSEGFATSVITIEKREYVPLEDVREKAGEEFGWDDLKMAKQKVPAYLKKRILKEYELNGNRYEMTLTQRDKQLIETQSSLQQRVDEWKERYGSLSEIPKEVLVRNSFYRVKLKHEWRLFTLVDGEFLEFR